MPVGAAVKRGETDKCGNYRSRARRAAFAEPAELAALSQALAEARDGTGGLVVMEGPAGIGKSRLLAETRTAAFAQGMAVLTARGTDLERDAPFGVVSELLAAVLAAPQRTGRAGVEGARIALSCARMNASYSRRF